MNKTKSLLSFAFISACLLLLASCKQTPKTVVVAGDSWAAFVCVYKSLDTSLKKEGITDTSTNATCPVTTRIGMHADNWLGSTYDKATQAALLDTSVKVLYLSLGGNDVLSLWNTKLTRTEEDAIYQKITSDVVKVVTEYQKQRPDIKIILSGYDYPRFTEDNAIAEYKELYHSLGEPSANEINSAIVRFSELMSTALKTTNASYIQHYGLMHYYFGNTTAGLAPEKTLSPIFISSPDNVNRIGGDVSLLADPAAMLKVAVSGVEVGDAFHLSKTGYGYIADHTVYHYLKAWLTEQK